MIDVFICTYNPSYNYLKRTVEGILAQDMDKQLWTLTIIDNNSKNPVADIDFVKQLGINVVVERSQGLTAARGCAVSVATNKLLIFVDDDMVIETNYLSTVAKIFEDENIGIISGRIVPEYAEQPGDWFYRFEGMLAIRLYENLDGLNINQDKLFNELFPVGAGMCIRRELLHEYYHQHLPNEVYIEGRKGDELSSSEDLDLDLYAISKGLKIGISTNLQSLHLIPANRLKLEYLTRLAFFSMKSNYQLNKKWKPVFKQNVFTFFNEDRKKLFMRMIYHRLLSFSPSHHIRYHHFKNLLQYI